MSLFATTVSKGHWAHPVSYPEVLFPGNTELEYECDRTVIVNLQYVVTEETLPAYVMVLVQHSLGKTEKKHEKIH